MRIDYRTDLDAPMGRLFDVDSGLQIIRCVFLFDEEQRCYWYYVKNAADEFVFDARGEMMIKRVLASIAFLPNGPEGLVGQADEPVIVF